MEAVQRWEDVRPPSALELANKGEQTKRKGRPIGSRSKKVVAMVADDKEEQQPVEGAQSGPPGGAAVNVANIIYGGRRRTPKVTVATQELSEEEGQSDSAGEREVVLITEQRRPVGSALKKTNKPEGEPSIMLDTGRWVLN